MRENYLFKHQAGATSAGASWCRHSSVNGAVVDSLLHSKISLCNSGAVDHEILPPESECVRQRCSFYYLLVFDRISVVLPEFMRSINRLAKHKFDMECSVLGRNGGMVRMKSSSLSHLSFNQFFAIACVHKYN